MVVKGGIAYGFRAPDLRQTISDWGQSSRGGNIYGNPDLKAETSRTYELGVGYDTAGGVELGATIYYTEFKDKIDRLSCVQAGAWCASEPPNTFGSFPTTYTNLDKAKLHGLELSINAPLTRTLELKATGTLTHSEVQDGDRQGSLNDTPKQQASISLNWKPTERFSSYVRAVYRGEERVPVPALIGNSSSGDSAAPAYTTVDLGGTYKLTSNTTLSAGVQNLFNKKLDYDTVGYMIDGTRVWVGLAATF